MIKTKKTYLIIASIALLCGIMLFFAKKTKLDFDYIKRSGTLRIIAYSDTINFFYENNVPQGFFYELIEEFADSNRLSLQITQESDLKKSIELLHKHKADILLRTLPSTSELKRQIAFSAPILKSELRLIQNKANKIINKPIELENETIYVEEYSPYRLRLDNMKQELNISFYIADTTLTTKQLIESVAKKKIKYTVGDLYIGRYYMSENANIDANTAISMKYFQAWGISPDAHELKSKIDLWIKQKQQTESFWNLFRKYYK